MSSSLRTPRPAPGKPVSVITNSSVDEDVHSGRAWARTVRDPWDPLILTLGKSPQPLASWMVHPCGNETSPIDTDIRANRWRRHPWLFEPPHPSRHYERNLQMGGKIGTRGGTNTRLNTAQLQTIRAASMPLLRLHVRNQHRWFDRDDAGPPPYERAAMLGGLS